MTALFLVIGYLTVAYISTAIRLEVINRLAKGRDNYRPMFDDTPTGPGSSGLLWTEKERQSAPMIYGVLWPAVLPAWALRLVVMAAFAVMTNPFKGLDWILKKLFKI